jgi:hypothetical protein
MWMLPLEIGPGGLRAGKPEPFLRTSADERFPVFSPDGRWLAYCSSESGSLEVYVRAFPDRGGKWQVSSGGGVLPVWSRDGRQLFFRTEDSTRIMAVAYTVQGDSFVPEKARVWLDKPIANIGTIGNYDVSPDGKRVAALMPMENPEQQKTQNHVTFLLNFLDHVRRTAK